MTLQTAGRVGREQGRKDARPSCSLGPAEDTQPGSIRRREAGRWATTLTGITAEVVTKDQARTVTLM